MIVKIKRRFKEISASWIIKSPKLCSIYYGLISGSFNNEHFAVLSGIYKNKMDYNNLGNFRRSIHRIEKGLITKPSKPVFAEDYIIETVTTLKTLLYKENDHSMIQWALSILNQYFSVVEETTIIRKAKELYITNLPEKLSSFATTLLAQERVKSKIEYNDFLDLNRQRRSIRYYLNKPVPRNLVEDAIRAALQAPSACNREPFMFRIIDDPLMLKDAVLLPNGSRSFSDNIKMMIFVIGDLSNYFSERDRHLIYIDGSLSVMSFVLALETLGLSSCIINWADLTFNNIKLKRFLKLNNWEQCIMAISVGYSDPDSGVPLSLKKEVNSVIKYN